MYTIFKAETKNVIKNVVKFYCDRAIESTGDVDPIGLWPMSSALTIDDCYREVYTRTSELLRRIDADIDLNAGEAWGIWCAVTMALDLYDDTRGEAGPITDSNAYSIAIDWCAIMQAERTDRLVSAQDLIKVMADAMLGHYGADIADIKLLSDAPRGRWEPAASDRYCPRRIWKL